MQLGSVTTLGGPAQAWAKGMKSAPPVGCTWCGHAMDENILGHCIEVFLGQGNDVPMFVFSVNTEERHVVLHRGESWI